MNEGDRMPSQYIYRLEQVEKGLEDLTSSVDELLLELKAGKKAGRWLLGIAVAAGAFISWILTTWYQVLTLKITGGGGGG